MKKTILAVALSLPLFAFGQDEAKEYGAHKLIKQKAENSCTVLANITLHSTDYRAIAIHAEPKTKGVIIPYRKGYHIFTVYPY